MLEFFIIENFLYFIKNELEKSLKRFLKGKFKITLATVVAFAISGNMVLGATTAELETRIAELEKLISSGTGTSSIKIGTETTDASGFASTAMGKSTTASGEYSTAMGYKTKALGWYSTAMGRKSLAFGSGSLAAGGYYDVDISKECKGGQALSRGSMALGAETVAGQKYGIEQGKQEAVAIGYRAAAEGNKSMSLGYDIKSNKDNNFIFGSGVDATGKTNIIVLGASSTAVDNALSIGSKGKERQIKFVKAGVDDTDAVNFKQLKDAVKGLGSGSGSGGVSSLELTAYYKKSETYNQTEVNKKIDDLAKATTTDIDVVACTVVLTDCAKTKEVDDKLKLKADKTYVDTELNKKADKKAVEKNTTKIENHETRITKLETASPVSQNFDKIKNDIKNNTKAIDKLDKKVVEMVNGKEGDVNIGAAVGGFEGTQAVAVGVAYAPTNNLSLAGKVSISKYVTYGAGFNYRFNIKK